MTSEIGKKDRSATQRDSTVKRRGLIRIGTLMTAFTGASAVSAITAASAQAEPIDATALNAYVPIAEKGAPSGVAELDVDAKIPAAQLPDLSATILDRIGSAASDPTSILSTTFRRSSIMARNAREAGIDADGIVDETVKICQFLQDSLKNQREAYFPRGCYLYDQIVFPSGLKMAGSGIGGYASGAAQAGTMFRQKLGANKPGLVFSGNLVGGLLQIGPADISHIAFRGEPSNASGHGIAFQAADGTPGTIQDTVIIKNCLFRYWKQSGIYSPAGARPFHVEDCNFLWNGEYGIDFIQSTANYVQAVHFQDISGDGNLLGLVRLKGLDRHGSITFTSVKSERRINPAFANVAGQSDCIITEDCDDAAVTIQGLTHISSVPSGAVHEPPGSAIVVRGTGKAQFAWDGVTVRVRVTDVPGAPATLRDEALGHSIPEGIRQGVYGGTDGKYTWSQFARPDPEGLSYGESTIPRTDSGMASSIAMTSGTVRLTYKTATKTETVRVIEIPCGGTAAAPTPTLIRVGVYSEEVNGDLKLVASSASNRALFARANAENNIPLMAPFTKIRGKRYAVGLLVVTTHIAPTVFGSTSLISSIIAKGPTLAAVRTAQSDLPASITKAQVAAGPSAVRFYAELLP